MTAVFARAWQYAPGGDSACMMTHARGELVGGQPHKGVGGQQSPQHPRPQVGIGSVLQIEPERAKLCAVVLPAVACHPSPAQQHLKPGKA